MLVELVFVALLKGAVSLFPLDLPMYQPGSPAYAATYAVSLIFVAAILGASLAVSLREGNADYKERTSKKKR